MRLLKLSAAIALMAGSFGLTATAEAQHYDSRHRVEHREVRRDHARRDDRRYRRPHSRHHGYRRARHCRMEWRHHRRIRVCR